MQGDLDSPTKYAGFTRRLAARIIDWFVVLIVAFVIGLPSSLIFASFRAEDFQAYTDWTLFNQDSLLSWESLAENESDNFFNCQSADDEASCLRAESFAIDQAALILGIFILIQAVYFTLLTSSKFQATLGKRLLKVKVVDGIFERPSWWQALTREIIFLIFFLSLLLGLYQQNMQLVGVFLELTILASCLKIVFSSDKTAIHDNLAFTKVILNN